MKLKFLLLAVLLAAFTSVCYADWENPLRTSSDVCWSAAQFTASEPFRKIAFSIDSCASTIDELTLCAYSPSVVDTLAWRSRP